MIDPLEAAMLLGLAKLRASQIIKLAGMWGTDIGPRELPRLLEAIKHEAQMILNDSKGAP